MERMEFLGKMKEIKSVMSESDLKNAVKDHVRGESDVPICVGELAELTLELTRYQRGKLNMDDFLQELSHVQWAVWTLQKLFDVEDEDLRRAIQASFR